jgi:predicted esterase
MAVSASQTSFTPGLKLHAPAANEGTIRANARRQDGWRFLKRRDVRSWHKADIDLQRLNEKDFAFNSLSN